MNLEKQVSSLELSIKLKELGVKQESLFSWEEPNEEWGWTDWVVQYGSNNDPQFKHFSAFTVAELGEKLRKQNKLSLPEWDNFHKQWFSSDGDENNSWFEADTEADARAKMLIYLLENKLIKL